MRIFLNPDGGGEAEMLKNPANRQDLFSIHVTADLTLGAFQKMAGRPGIEFVKSLSEAFFITSASPVLRFYCNSCGRFV